MRAEKPVSGVNDENDYDRNTYTPEQIAAEDSRAGVGKNNIIPYKDIYVPYEEYMATPVF